MATVTMTIEEYEALMALVRNQNGTMPSPMLSQNGSSPSPAGKKRRKRSKYQKELGRQLKMLKKKHPRTAITRLMKRAHSLTRKALK